MRMPLLATAAVLVAACAGGPVAPARVSGPAPAPASQTFGCVNQKLRDMGYRVASTDEQAGVIVAMHPNPQPFWRRMLGFRDTADQLTVSVAQGQLQVTAVSSDPAEEGGASGTASGAARTDAQRLLQACRGSA